MSIAQQADRGAVQILSGQGCASAGRALPAAGQLGRSLKQHWPAPLDFFVSVAKFLRLLEATL